jgi:hypothetical protein
MWLADTLSRTPLPEVYIPSYDFEVFSTDIDNTDNKPDRITDTTLELVKHLVPYINYGWPDEQNKVPNELHQFWTYRSELVYTDRIIYKGIKILVPEVV